MEQRKIPPSLPPKKAPALPPKSASQVSPPLPPKQSSSSSLPPFPGTPNPANDFDGTEFVSIDSITDSARLKYKLLFQQADGGRKGYVDGKDAKVFFPRSGIPNSTLAAVWRASDFDQDSKLDLNEFQLAMHFTIAAKKGYQIPSVLPVSLIPCAKTSSNVIVNEIENPPPEPEYIQNPEPTKAPPTLPKKPSLTSFQLNEPTPSPQVPSPTPQAKPPLPSRKSMILSNESVHGNTGPAVDHKDYRKSMINPSTQRLSSTFAEDPFGTDSSLAKSQSLDDVSKESFFAPTVPSKPSASLLKSSSDSGTLRKSGPPIPIKTQNVAQLKSEAEKPKAEDSLINTISSFVSSFSQALNTPTVTEDSQDDMKLSRYNSWYDFYIGGNQTVPAVDYLSKVPREVQTSFQFLKYFFHGDINKCHQMMAPNFAQVCPISKLSQILGTLSALKEHWTSKCTTIDQPNFKLCYYQLFSNFQTYLAKFYVLPNLQITGMYFEPFAPEKWCCETGKRGEWLVCQPRIVNCYDGSRLEVISKEDEFRAMMNPNVPKGILVGPDVKYHVKISDCIKLNKPSDGKPLAIAMIPPELHSQKVVDGSIKLQPYGLVSESTSTHNAALITVPFNEISAVIGMEYDITLRSSILAPIYVGHKYIRPLYQLTEKERKFFTKSSTNLELECSQLLNFIANHNLRIQNNETPIDFARRAYLAVAMELQYFSPPAMKVSEIIAQLRGDCASINKVFVAILRANGIPARLINGRHAKSIVEGETLSWGAGTAHASGTNKLYEQTHVQSQFWVDTIGWIPTDPTFSVKNNNPKYDSSNPETLLNYFGCDRGTFITFALDEPGKKNFEDRNIWIHSQRITISQGHEIIRSDWIVNEIK